MRKSGCERERGEKNVEIAFDYRYKDQLIPFPLPSAGMFLLSAR
jgi:hypothetical protein